ncbi:DUF2339 domain-containing protein [Geobacter argillaceus]|uniref:Putative membrane protein DUF2339 n=1 Tax=Geobacter argillaceus TaxID=345631 RepID=A0A562WQI7_9BACT|nr:DUF2339 domain-containing protein [Geobacter argillaceus]TWJ32416.1 putative membrane protein DUF2339 [Geobacter argillaceus]
MADALSTLEQKVNELTTELQALKQRVDLLSTSREQPIEPLDTVLPAAPPYTASPYIVFSEKTEKKIPPQPSDPSEVTEELLTWAGKASLLPRLATLCFLLVVALILRTITDAGLINNLTGSGIGMGYAAALMLTGWYLFHRGNPLAPVFAACGAALMGTIVVETHARFQSLPLVPAYFTLMATGVAMAVVSYRYNAFTPISVGTMSMCLAGAAIDYPHPFFPYLAMILVTANVLGCLAARIKRCSWMRWIILCVTLAMLHLWALRLGTALYRQQQPAPELAPTWFIPALVALVAAYLAIAIFGILRSGSNRIARFDFSLPTINVIWSFAAAYYVVGAGMGSKSALGIICIVAAAFHIGLGAWLASRHLERAPGTNSFVVAGTVLLAMALPVAFGNALPALPILSGMACGLCYVASRWQSGGVRLSSYLLQAYAAVVLALVLFSRPTSAQPYMGSAAALIVAGIGLFHYRHCRKTPPPTTSEIFTRLDTRDSSGAIPLLAALVSAFFFLRVIMQQLLGSGPGAADFPFRSAQSTIINLSAIVLMFIAFRQRNKELRNIAILVTVVGAAKVFLSDLIGIQGMPLVVSVFSFGLAAALESVALGKWQGGKESSPPLNGPDP